MKKRMNNLGFTLVELLAVIVILLGIAAVSVFNISSSLKRNEEQECSRQKEIIRNAAKIYFSLHPTEENINVSELKEAGYLKEGDYTLNEIPPVNVYYDSSQGTYCFEDSCNDEDEC